jgi:hypothetical protein
LHLLSVADYEVQRLDAEVELLEEYRLTVDELRATALTLDRPAPGRQVVDDPSAKRVTQHLVRLRETWEPGWLSHVASKGKSRLNDASFMALQAGGEPMHRGGTGRQSAALPVREQAGAARTGPVRAVSPSTLW